MNISPLNATKLDSVLSTDDLAEDSLADVCSICAVTIANYVPDYFCGEPLNPACIRCKSAASIEEPDPFSSFPVFGMPISLASHWNPIPAFQENSLDISSILSMRSHYVRIPDPGATFSSMEHLLQDFREILRVQRLTFIEDFRQMFGTLATMK